MPQTSYTSVVFSHICFVIIIALVYYISLASDHDKIINCSAQFKYVARIVRVWFGSRYKSFSNDIIPVP